MFRYLFVKILDRRNRIF